MAASPPPDAVYRGFINQIDSQVVESIDGFLLLHPHCTRLDGGNDIKVVMRNDWKADSAEQVALISGGGDGHAPSHAGFVGAGMLTAAVSGQVFASPSVKAVLAGIRAVARPSAASAASPGALLIVKNYTGDRLSFGLAMSKALLEGIPVEMVIVADDVTLPRSKGVTGRRGIAGTVLVHKIAGFAAAQGKSLAEVARLADEAACTIVSIGIATTHCNVPGNVSDPARLPPGMMELGVSCSGQTRMASTARSLSFVTLIWTHSLCFHRCLFILFLFQLGIHNEAGMQTLPLESARSVVARMVAQLLSRDREHDYFWRGADEAEQRSARPGTEIVLLVNNLGAATATEVNIVTAEAIALLQREHGLVVRRVLAGPFMTALDMKGLSITIMRLDDDAARAQWQLEAIDAPVEASGWPKTVVKDPHAPAARPVPAAPQSASGEAAASAASTSSAASSVASESLLAALATTILQNASLLNELDAKAGDGDCGSTLSLGARAVQAALAEGQLQRLRSLSQLLQSLAESIGETMGGSSGAIVQILLTAAAAAAKAHEAPASSTASPLPLALALALESGIGAVTKFGGAVEGDRTMLDALCPAVRALKEALQADSAATGSAIKQAAAAARTGALRTRGMVGRAGRSNYVSGAALSEADPGAEAVALLFEAVAAAEQQ